VDSPTEASGSWSPEAVLSIFGRCLALEESRICALEVIRSEALSLMLPIMLFLNDFLGLVVLATTLVICSVPDGTCSLWSSVVCRKVFLGVMTWSVFVRFRGMNCRISIS
jgi:hypothetical protein